MILFGFSMNPKIRLLIGAAALAIGIALHLIMLIAVGAALVAMAAYLLIRNLRKNTR